MEAAKLISKSLYCLKVQTTTHESIHFFFILASSGFYCFLKKYYDDLFFAKYSEKEYLRGAPE